MDTNKSNAVLQLARQQGILRACDLAPHGIERTYGRMTVDTRQISAYRRNSLIDVRYMRRQSRRASMATSRPMLLRKRKQYIFVAQSPVMTLFETFECLPFVVRRASRHHPQRAGKDRAADRSE